MMKIKFGKLDSFIKKLNYHEKQGYDEDATEAEVNIQIDGKASKVSLKTKEYEAYIFVMTPIKLESDRFILDVDIVGICKVGNFKDFECNGELLSKAIPLEIAGIMEKHGRAVNKELIKFLEGTATPVSKDTKFWTFPNDVMMMPIEK